MSRRFHMGLSVRGALRWPVSELAKLLRDSDGDGGFLSPQDAREALMEELSKGHEVLPIGDCPDWDYTTGCPGHEEADEAKEGKP